MAPPAPRVGDLEGTVGEAQDGYPYGGRHAGGHVSLRSTARSNMAGSAFELQLDDTIPRSLILQDFRGWLGLDGRTLLDLEWQTPTEEDSRFRGVYRDLRNFDLGATHLDSRWFDRPREQASHSTRDEAWLRLRKWSSLQLDLRLLGAKEDRLAMVRDRSARWDQLDARATGLVGDVRVDAGLRSAHYQDAGEATDGHDDQRLHLSLSRDVGPNTNLRAQVQTDERTLTASGEVQRDLALALSTRTYDLFGNRGLKFMTEASYRTRPASFQRTQDDEDSLRLGLRVAWDTGAGAFEGGYRQVSRQVERLTRAGVETLLVTPDTPLAVLQGLRESAFPDTQKSWIQGTMPVLKHRVRLFGRHEELAVDGPPASNWTARNSPPLEYTDRTDSGFGVSVFPTEGVDLRAERRTEQRLLAGRGDHVAGQDQRVEQTLIGLHLAVLPRVDLNFQASDLDVHHVDDAVQAGTVDEVSSYALDLSYALSESVSLESSYQRLNHDGVSGATQEVVGFAIDYGGGSGGTHLRLDYLVDDFLDQAEGASSYRARLVNLSARLGF